MRFFDPENAGSSIVAVTGLLGGISQSQASDWHAAAHCAMHLFHHD